VRAREVFDGDDAAKTRAYYAAIERRGAIGEFAANLMRAQKASTRAKRYRGGISGVGSFSDLAYQRKGECLTRLCDSLLKPELRGFAGEPVRWGWKVDPTQPFAKWVLYVDLPNGQVSFHSTERFGGPDYPAEFDGAHASAERIIAFCDFVFMNPPQGQLPLPQQLPL
jgi:hypothetical protein